MNQHLNPCDFLYESDAFAHSHASLLDYFHSTGVFEQSLDAILGEVAQILQGAGGAVVEFEDRTYIAGRPSRAGVSQHDIVVDRQVKGRLTVSGLATPQGDEAARLNALCVSCFLDHYFAVEKLKVAKDDLAALNSDLEERIKEQRCLYDVIRLTVDRNEPLDVVMAEVIAALPGGWLHSDDLVAEIDISGARFVSTDYRQPVSAISAPLTQHGAIFGTITVGYKRPHPTRDNGPFLEQETKLLESIAARLSGYVRRLRTDEARRGSEERWREVFDATSQPLLLVENGRFSNANRAALDLLRMREPAELIGRTPASISPPFQPDGASSEEKARAGIAKAFDQGFYSFEWEHVRADGEHFIAQVVLTRILQRGKSLLLAVWNDISREKQAQAALAAAMAEAERRARTDFLTDLPNRAHFFDVAERELARARRYESMFSVAMIDIDHFKRVNDRLGHHAGDVVLREFARICRGALRETDFVGRIGGEEFAILFPQTRAQEAFEVAERVRGAIAQSPVTVDGGETLAISISIGVAAYAPLDKDIDALLGRADKALYAAKRAGRNRTALAPPA